MRKFFKYASMMAVAVIAAASFASCSDDDTEGSASIPQPTIGSVQVTDHTAALTITPPAGATSIFWACADSKTTPKEFTQVEVNSAAPIEITTGELNYGRYKIYAFTQTAQGNSKVLSSPEFEIALNDLIGYRIINKTAYSLDVQVTMGADCEKYVIGAFSNGSYDEKNFIESAKTSISPNSSYPMQPYNVFETDALIPESMLSKGTLASSNESKGIVINYGSKDDQSADYVPNKYQIAIYAIDKQGEGHVLTTDEFEVELPAFGENLPVKITAETTLTKVTATYTAPAGAKKMIRGFALPYENHDVDWEDPAAVEAALSTMAVTNPPYLCLYEGQRFTEIVPKDIHPSWPVYVYAAAIDENGQMGKLTYEKFTTQTPVLDGTATVGVEFVSAEEKAMTFKVTLSDDASQVRLLVQDASGFAGIKDDLGWIFVDPNLSYYYVQKAAYEVKYGNVVVPCPYPGTTYKVCAVAVGRDGKVSPVQFFDDQKTKEEVVPVPIDFSKGIGEATLTTVSAVTYYSPGDEWGTPESWTVDYTYKVAAGANTKNVYVFTVQDAINTPEGIEEAVLNSSGTDVEMRERTPFTDFGVDKTQKYMYDQDPRWGGSAVVVVTEDNDGNFKIAAYYAAVADHTVKTERE